MENLKIRTIHAYFWKFSEQILIFVVQLIIQILLARILSPRDFGLVGYISVFVIISDLIIRQGFTSALIQKKQPDQLDYSSVFYTNIIVSIFVYILFFCSSPYIAKFYKEKQLCNILRLLLIIIIIGAFGNVHNAINSRKLTFYNTFIQNFVGMIIYGFVGLYLALNNYKVYALIYARISQVTISTLLICYLVKWKPTLQFSIKRIKALFSYSSNILMSNFFNTLFQNINTFIIGRLFTTEDLAYYQRGHSLPSMAMGPIDSSMSQVMFPAFSKLQDNLEMLKSALRKSLRTSLYFVLPLLFGLLVTARSLVIILFSDKWLPSVKYIQLSCIICMFWPFVCRNHALNSIGLSNLTLRLSIVSKILFIIQLIFLAKYGIEMILLCSIITSFIMFFVTSYFVNKYIHYSLYEIIEDCLPILFVSIFMGGCVYSIGLFIKNIYIIFPIQIILGIIIYFSLSLILKLQAFKYILSMLKSK